MNQAELDRVAGAAVAYAKVACFSHHFGYLCCDGHLVVLFSNRGNADCILSFVAEYLSGYEYNIVNSDDGYSSAIAIYSDQGTGDELRFHWSDHVTNYLKSLRAA